MATPADIIAGKTPLPTSLDSAGIRARIAADILRRSVFSARTAERAYLDAMQGVLRRVASGALADQDAEDALRAWLDGSGYLPPEGAEGTITDLSSHRRIKLILNTNADMAAGAAQAQAQDTLTLDAYPAWELIRAGHTREPRDWPARWREAGRSVNWDRAARDRFAARKDSPIWQAIGDGAGGFTDTLGNPFPPFAFNSRMTWAALPRAEAEALGITGSPAPPDAPLSPGERDLIAALEAHGPGFASSLVSELEAIAS
mgnify:CR=1 FL=1